MSTTPPTAPAAEPARVPLPPERRTLVALLAALEGLLLVAASVLAALYRPQPGIVYCVTSVTVTCSTAQGSCAGAPSGPYPCSPSDATAHIALLVAAVCAVVAVLVLPPVLGALSRRWQTALAAPSLPVWLALLVGVTLVFVTRSDALNLYPTGGPFGDLYYAASLVVSAVGPLLLILFLVAGLGGLGWLTRRAFAR
jgi:hypothetical protein